MNTGTPHVAKRLVSDKVSKSPLTPCRRVGLGRPSSGSLKKITCTTPRNNTPEKLQTPVNVNNETEQLICHIGGGGDNKLEIPSSSSGVFNEESALGGNLSLSRTNSNRVNVKRALCHSKSNGNSSSSQTKSTTDDFSAFSPMNSVSSSLKNNTKKQKISSDQSFNVEHFLSDPGPIVDLPELHVADYTVTVTSDSNAANNDNVTTDMIHKLVSSIKEKNNRLELMKVQQTYSRKHDLEELRAQTARWRSAAQEALRHAATLAAEPGTIKRLIDRHGFSPGLVQYSQDDDDFL